MYGHTVNTQHSLCPFVTSPAEHPRRQTTATCSGLKGMESNNLVVQLGRDSNMYENDSTWRISEDYLLYLVNVSGHTSPSGRMVNALCSDKELSFQTEGDIPLTLSKCSAVNTQHCCGERTPFHSSEPL